MKTGFPLAAHGVALIAALLATTLAQAETLTLPVERISDQRIQADYQGLTATQQRIKALNDGQQTASIPVGDYRLAKAQCWLDAAVHEYTRNDRSAFVQAALDESVKIIGALEQQATASPADQTPLINGASKLREDLWRRADSLRHTPGHRCAAAKVACAEVELVHAGNEINQQGWRHAKPYIQIAEDLLSEASDAASHCPSATVQAPAPQPAAPQPSPQAAIQVENHRLSASTLFRFDGGQLQHLLPQGKIELDRLVDEWSRLYQTIEHISVTGYTDRLGSDRRNAALSQQRADTVAAYLKSRGINAPFSTQGKGSVEQLAPCGSSTRHTTKLIDCLQPNRRVNITISGVKR
ncbi:outer membrane protein OmpA-like peptidoglycan-associated protein [Chitinivorax tropicus]|uniref:Outer membrane protein OmpA-like peptidoglycan-associated protein n=1 Tax=Chitinivorax tropicus TaxID=714531 RepID=A0A840MNP8_9PROT|nr:OmpA family protein [Chitinivorax tropicus]MBB5019095.1 outer membrane protein OmpA-like peptidoglycan-associated protein [Chitinivorax tropicus]